MQFSISERISRTARVLLEARASGARLAALPEAVRPRDEAEAVAIQLCVADALGEIGGFKVGAAGPDAEPSCAPMAAVGIFESPAQVDGAVFTQRGVESEIAFVMGRDLPPVDKAYSRAAVMAAIASCHAGIEILQSRFVDVGQVDEWSRLADGLQHGGYVLGRAIAQWRELDFAELRLVQLVGADEKRAVGNPAGDMIRLVQWLANVGAVRFGGLRAGQVITCGSWAGSTPAEVGDRIFVSFDGFAPVEMIFVRSP